MATSIMSSVLNRVHPLLCSHGSWSYCVLTTVRSYAAKKLVGKMAPTAQKSRMEVETDPEKLLKYCCGANVYQDGSDPEIKADSEYPDWLWNLRTDRQPPPLSELDPDTKYYWDRLHRITTVRNRNVAKHLAKIRRVQYPDDEIL